MEIKELIGSLGDRIGIQLALDADGACSFEADGLVVTLNHFPEINSLALTGDVGEPPPEKLESLYKAMLEANCAFAGTAGATLSLDSASGRFSLCRALPLATLGADSLYAAVEGFVNTLDAWHKIVANYRAPAEGQSAGVESEFFSPGHGFMQV